MYLTHIYRIFPSFDSFITYAGATERQVRKGSDIAGLMQISQKFSISAVGENCTTGESPRSPLLSDLYARVFLTLKSYNKESTNQATRTTETVVQQFLMHEL
jgi:hypothetical protein